MWCKKKWYFISGLLLTVFLLISCGEAGTEKDAHGEKILQQKEKIICYSLESNSYMMDLANVFNVQSVTTEVEVRCLSDELYDEEIDRLLRKGEAADVVWIRQPSKSNNMADAGLLYDLSDLVKDSALDISCYGQSLDIVQLDERIYSLPFVQNIWLLFYNQDIFRELSLDDPGHMTWHEYAALARRIQGRTSDGKIRWGGYIPAWVVNLGGLEMGEYLYADELPATKEFLQFLNQIYSVEGTHPHPLEMGETYPSGYAAFLDGEIGMMINGDWTIQILQTLGKERTKSCHWGAAPLPVMENAEEGVSVGSNSYLGVAALSSHPENAFEFVQFCSGEDGASVLASLNCFPSYYTENSREIYTRNLGMGKTDFFFDAILYNEEGKYLLYKDLRAVFDEEALLYLKGEKSLEEAMRDYENRRSQLSER